MALWHHGGEIYGSDTIRLDYSVNINPLGFPRRALEALGAKARLDGTSFYRDVVLED